MGALDDLVTNTATPDRDQFGPLPGRGTDADLRAANAANEAARRQGQRAPLFGNVAAVEADAQARRQAARGATRTQAPAARPSSSEWDQFPPVNRPPPSTGAISFDDLIPPAPAKAKSAGLFDDIIAAPSKGGKSTPNLDAMARSSPNEWDQFPRADNRWQQDPISQPESSAIGSALRSGLQGLTFGTSDEIGGLEAAAPEGIRNTIGRVPLLGDFVSGVSGAFQLATGGEGAQARYDKAVADARAQLDADRTQHPYLSTLGELGGMVATMPFTAPLNVVRGAGLGARVANAALQGIVGGGAYGLGTAEGSLADRAATGLTGAGAGLVGGAGVPLVGRAVGEAAKAVSAPVRNAIRSVVNPEAEAARRVAGALARDQADPGRVVNALAGANQAGIPVVAGDLGGDATRALARSAANASPEARAALEATAEGRFQSQQDRVTDFIGRLVAGSSDTTATRDALEAAARRANRPAYLKAYAAGDRPIMSPELERLMSSPDVVDAMAAAVKRGRSRAVAEGYGAFNPAVKVTDDGRVAFAKGKGGAPVYPDLKFWDFTLRELQDSSRAAFRSGRNEEGSTLSTLARQMKGELDTLVPEYADARSTAAAFFGAQDALEAGQRFVGASLDNGVARKALAKMNAAEKQLFAQGFAGQLINQVAKTGFNRDVTNALFLNTPRAKERIVMALGQRPAAALESFLRVENVMGRLRGALGSAGPDKQKLLEVGLSGLAGFEIGGGNILDPKTWLTAALGAGLARGRVAAARAVNERVARQVGDLLTSNDPKRVQQALNIVSANPRLQEAVRWAEGAIAKIPGMEGGQGMALAQAQDQQ